MSDLERIDRGITHRLRIKKLTNIALCAVIFFLSLTAFIFKARYEGGVLTCFREMTVDGTVFTGITSLLLVIFNTIELCQNNQHSSRAFYFWRLSSAVTEFMILFIVFLGFLPFWPYDNPVLLRYDMMNMHLIVPVLTMISFCINDEPIGRPRAYELLGGLNFLVIYGVSMIVLILLDVVPEDKIPYSFLNVKHGVSWITIAVGALVFGAGYGLSWLFWWLNRKLSWIWYRGIAKDQR